MGYLVDGGGAEDEPGALVLWGWPTPEFAMPVAIPTPAQMCAFLGWDDPEDLVKVAPHLYTMMSTVRAYTRGVGFYSMTEPETEILCNEDIYSVILTATARLVTNPAQVIRQEIGGWSEVPARFEGFTNAEQLVLNRYRRRTA